MQMKTKVKESLLKAASRLADVVDVGTCLLLMSASQSAARQSYQPPTPISWLCTFIEPQLHTLSYNDGAVSRSQPQDRVFALWQSG
ncbi:jg22699 [Pararge aegeria aegeria]|uniref:Jg22699 protein n=1 Tax=Pararge aegeria aegeria TaxID=348720 RepID=A0A8S4QYG3_9NEOP|nr:jg22699 [Pararge aegeria aegeria]